VRWDCGVVLYQDRMNNFRNRVAVLLAVGALVLGASATPASAAPRSFVGTGTDDDSSAAYNLARHNAQNRADTLRYVDCVVTDSQMDDLPGVLVRWTITLTCARQSGPRMPDVVFELQGNAISVLEEFDAAHDDLVFDIRTSTVRVPDRFENGRVVTQSPGANTVVPRGTVVVTLSIGRSGSGNP
jgi:hypothetical protein